MVRVEVNPGFPPLKLAIGHEQPLLPQVEDAATGIVSNPPQLPGTNKATPAQANQSTATFIHLIQERQHMELALHRQEVEREVVVLCFATVAYRNQGSFPRRHVDWSEQWLMVGVRISTGKSCGLALP